jgi:hypothetical protein
MGSTLIQRKSLRWLSIFLKNVYVYYTVLQDLLPVFHEMPHIITQCFNPYPANIRRAANNAS